MDANEDGNYHAQIASMIARSREFEAKVVTLEKEKAELTAAVETLTAQDKTLDDEIIAKKQLIRKYRDEIMQKWTHGQVLAVNSEWGFCVLNIGDQHGANANGIMTVSRNGQVIGKVKITSLEKLQSVADILQNTFARGTHVEPGDSVKYLPSSAGRGTD